MTKLFTFKEYCAKYLKIRTKDGELVNLVLNTYQERFVDLVDSLRAKRVPVRIIILKARQVGFSTISEALIYFLTAMNFNQKSMTIAHDDESTTELFEMVKLFYDLCDPTVRPMSRYSNRKELVFQNPDDATRRKEPGLLSSMVVATAGSKTAGRSTTRNHIHISELAYWQRAKKIIAGLLGSLSDHWTSTCIIESTANGFDGDGKEFYRRCNAAMKGRGSFVFFFVGWCEVKEYRIIGGEVKEYTKTEERLRNTHCCDDEQLAWRRWKIADGFGGDEMLFRQEFPASPEEAFITSGRPVFNNDKLFALIAQIKEKNYQEGYIGQN